MQVKNKLCAESLIKIFKGALIAGCGAGAIFALEALTVVDFGAYSELYAGMSAIVINSIKEFLKGQ